jgi:hypothetical protein
MVISNKLIKIFGFSVPIFIIHGLEEYFTGLYKVDTHSIFMFHFFEKMSSHQASFLLFQIMLWLLLIICYLLLSQKFIKGLLILLGLLYIYELSHIVGAVKVRGYYPGLISGLVIISIGVWYWKVILSKE